MAYEIVLSSTVKNPSQVVQLFSSLCFSVGADNRMILVSGILKKRWRWGWTGRSGKVRARFASGVLFVRNKRFGGGGRRGPESKCSRCSSGRLFIRERTSAGGAEGWGVESSHSKTDGQKHSSVCWVNVLWFQHISHNVDHICFLCKTKIAVCIGSGCCRLLRLLGAYFVFPAQ